MAPNDIPIGKKYAQVINAAIKDCACVILLLSDAAQNSSWVPKEIERAINYKKKIIPVKLEDMLLNDEFELYISSDQLIAIKQLDESSCETQKLLKSVVDACGYSEIENSHIPNREALSSGKPHRFKKGLFALTSAVLAIALFFALYGNNLTNDNTYKKIPFVNLSGAQDLVYPFRDLNGFSSKRNTFFMKNTNDKTLSIIDTSTGKMIRPTEKTDLGDADLSSSWVCHSEESDIIYFCCENAVKIYDSSERIWKNKEGVMLPLGPTELPAGCFMGIKNLKSSSLDEDDLFITVYDYEKNGGCYTGIIRLTPDGEIMESDLSELHIDNIVCGFDAEISGNGVPLLVWTLNETPIILDILTGQIMEDNCEEICKNYTPYANKDIQSISNDGKYIIKEKAYSYTENDPGYTEITVWSLQTGKNLFAKKLVGKYFVAFDKENRLLLYNNGTLSAVDLTTQEAEELLGPEFFISNPLFGEVPHNMYYSQKLDLCIWDTMVSRNESGIDLITITDLSGKVLYQCDDYYAPFDNFYTNTFVGDDFILHYFVSYNNAEITTIPLKVSYTRDKNGNIKLK